MPLSMRAKVLLTFLAARVVQAVDLIFLRVAQIAHALMFHFVDNKPCLN
jgi:hypothetical protein